MVRKSSYENESNNYVFFDDLKVTHTPTNVIQYNEYYPFGLQTAASWTRENNTGNNFLYNAGNELNSNTQWYEMFYRGYDPVLGRMLQVDPYASSFGSLTPYNYAGNSPVIMNDPSGGYMRSNSDTDPAYFGEYLPRVWYTVNGGEWTRHEGNNFDFGGSGSHGPTAQDYVLRDGLRLLGLDAHVTASGVKYWNPWGGDEISREKWLKLGGDENKYGSSYYPGNWETLGNRSQTQGSGGPIVFVSFDNAPKSFDKAVYMSELTSALIANGFSKSISVQNYSLTGKAKAWWNNSPNVTISLNYYYQGLVRDAGGYTSGLGSPDNPISAIVYWGLDDSSTSFNASISSYVNATLHEMGHGVFGFVGDTYGVSNSLMDYKHAYTPGQGFSAQEQAIIRASIWGH